MNLTLIIFIAFGLAMDAFAVSFSCGLGNSQKTSTIALKAGISFGFFQGIMPIAGWFLGSSFKNFIEPIDHWIAFFLLAIIGIHMIKEAQSQNCSVINLNNLRILLTLSIATSIDALAAGITFSILNINILIASFLIGVITLITSYAGVYIGKYAGCNSKLQGKVDIAGGIILIGIGVKMLSEHLL